MVTFLKMLFVREVAIIPAKTEDLLIEFIKQEIIAPNDYLFQFNNAPFRIEHLRKKFEQGKIKSGINTAGRKITMHSMRYTYVTRMRSLVDTDTVRKMVGHTNEKMTEYYKMNVVIYFLSKIKKNKEII